MKKAIAHKPVTPTGDTAQRLQQVQAAVSAAARRGGHPAPAIIAVSKTRTAAEIRPLLAAGQRQFGENRVQEAQGKWPELLADYPDILLHLVGQLQSNKADDAVRLFDVIHSLDRPSLVTALAKAIDRWGRHPRLFVQVNIGDEPQKGGVAIANLPALLANSRDCGLTIEGLMAVPPADKDPAPYFALLAKLAKRHELTGLSMGMSSDFDVAAALGATCIRIGTALFGERQP